jgi:Tfp pilus assembly protein PilF
MRRILGRRVPTLTAVSKSVRLAGAVAALLLTITTVGACSGNDDKSDADATASSQAAAADALVQQGLQQLQAGDTAGAQATFEKVLTVDADNKYAHFNLGVIAQQSGDDDTAMTDYDAAIASDDAFAPALYNKAILTEHTDLEAAVDLYRRTVDADPKMAAAYMRLGFALIHLGKKDEGADYLGQGVSIDPSMADVEAPSYD